ncbi:hypothetical protein K3495_g9541 [Podosphaera aphanis]|nr:hypothetical protein K3495_g9541 [Podosphaera aphanis]
MFLTEGKLRELCAIETTGFLVESKLCNTGVYFNSLMLAASNSVTMETWHRRLALISPNNTIRTKNIVDGMNVGSGLELKLRVCDSCELGTPLECKSKTTKNRTTDALARIHVDTFQFSPKSHAGYRYGMILTDKATSERLGQIKAWRMDGGTEYAPRQFKEMCAELGQRIEVSTPYAPWKDGKAELSIRTFIEKVRKTMLAMEIPAFLWPGIFLACIYISEFK